MQQQRTSNSSHAVIIIGSGFGGLGMGIQLKKAGIHDFLILEKGEGIGGTWRDNTYPGAACDVQSHLYSYSFEPKHDWSRKFGLQNEILAYIEHCTDRYDLRSHLRFNSEVVAAHFEQASGYWRVEIKDSETLFANVLITATGQLNQPAWPSISGLESFKGTQFHSARWNHQCDLTDKKVAVIGTGASAIQFVPQIVPFVRKLSLFQRSAAWVIPKPDRPFAQWEQMLFQRFPLWDRLYRSLIYWKNESRALAFTRFAALLELFAWKAKREVARHVQDPAKRAALIPDYKIGCKRILMANDWYQAVSAPQVDLVTASIDHVETDAIVTQDGVRHPVDVIILGTGFKTTDFLAPMQITGLDGVDLNTAWRAGAEAYKGISVAGFPNLFILYGPNTNLSHSSIIFMLESQIHYVMLCLQAKKQLGATSMDVKPARQQEFVNALQQRLGKTVWASGCASWYLDKSGRNVANWPGFTFSYRRLTRQFTPEDYQFNGDG